MLKDKEASKQGEYELVLLEELEAHLSRIIFTQVNPTFSYSSNDYSYFISIAGVLLK